ncbi:MAG: hydrogenase formation protein HypD, partial [Firmicutes bacterium]|nr:hydrogenase formation protein HypD [Bacillota bacterium]
MEIEKVVQYLQNYDGPEVKIMEVCGTHTSAIFKSGIRSLISPKIRLISGPGCPVCVTPTAYIDKCVEYAKKDGHILYSFGDMMKVPGTTESLSIAKGDGAKVELMFSPVDAVDAAEKDPDHIHVIAAVGFETTIPTYAVALEEAIRRGVTNVRLVTALKTTFPAIEWICENEQGIDAFICPGHVSVITGSDAFQAFADKYQRPFVVAGFEGEHLLAVLYDIMRQLESGKTESHNRYTNAVRAKG